MKRPNNGQIMTPPPDRELFEREVHDLFNNGDLSNIARYLQKDQALVSKSFNPYCEERHNTVYEFLRVLWAMDCTRESLADKTLCIVTREREKWLGEDPVPECPAKLTGNINREFTQFLEAELKGLSWDEQIKECVDIEVAARKKKADLIAKRNYEHFNGRFNPRVHAELAANGRRKK